MLVFLSKSFGFSQFGRPWASLRKTITLLILCTGLNCLSESDSGGIIFEVDDDCMPDTDFSSVNPFIPNFHYITYQGRTFIVQKINGIDVVKVCASSIEAQPCSPSKPQHPDAPAPFGSKPGPWDYDTVEDNLFPMPHVFGFYCGLTSHPLPFLVNTAYGSGYAGPRTGFSNQIGMLGKDSFDPFGNFVLGWTTNPVLMVSQSQGGGPLQQGYISSQIVKSFGATAATCYEDGNWGCFCNAIEKSQHFKGDNGQVDHGKLCDFLRLYPECAWKGYLTAPEGCFQNKYNPPTSLPCSSSHGGSIPNNVVLPNPK